MNTKIYIYNKHKLHSNLNYRTIFIYKSPSNNMITFIEDLELLITNIINHHNKIVIS